MRFAFPIMVMAALVATALVPASAQSTSADDIIKALRPTGPISNHTRGIRPTTGQTAPMPETPNTAPRAMMPAAAVAAPAVPHLTTTAPGAPARPAPKPASGPSINIQVLFEIDSAALTPAARASLDQLGKALSSPDLAGYRFRIEGHTDSVGSPDHNRSLSARRADAVVGYLTATYSVDRSHLESVGRGSDDPAVQTGPQTPEPRNRRVRVVNIGA